MLQERASQETIKEFLIKYPHAELCYRRDQLHINGEVSEEAGNESAENMIQSIHDLRQSPRARYILRKRILITLGLEKYSGDLSRSPILHGTTKQDGNKSALDILINLKGEKNLTIEEVDDDFLDEYINQLEHNRIRIHYVWPISV